MGMAYLAKEQEGQAVPSLGQGKVSAIHLLAFSPGNSEGNYSSCSEATNIDLLCRFSFMLGSKHQGPA